MSGDRPPLATAIEVGVVVKPHGLRGDLRVHLHNPTSEALEQAESLVLSLAGEERRILLRIVGRWKEGVLVHIDGVEDLDAAEALRSAVLLVDREAVEPQGEGEYLYADLVGCLVVEAGGEELGVVDSVFEAGASDVLVIRRGASERLVPLVDEFVRSVDLAARIIHTTDAGLFEALEPGPGVRVGRGRRRGS